MKCCGEGWDLDEPKKDNLISKSGDWRSAKSPMTKFTLSMLGILIICLVDFFTLYKYIFIREIVTVNHKCCTTLVVHRNRDETHERGKPSLEEELLIKEF